MKYMKFENAEDLKNDISLGDLIEVNCEFGQTIETVVKKTFTKLKTFIISSRCYGCSRHSFQEIFFEEHFKVRKITSRH